MKNTAQSSAPALTVLIGFLAAITAAFSQDSPRTGTYKVQSGFYHEDGGIAGPRSFRLPDSYQACVSLMMNPGDGGAELAFVGTNHQAVFLTLTNGVVSGNTIRFQYLGVHPFRPTRPAQVDYMVTNAAGRLWINGTITMVTPMPDFPGRLEHQAVSAIFLPALSIRVGSEVELRWSSASGQKYQVQCRSDLLQPEWANLGGITQGNGTTNSAIDVMAPVQSLRFYRILALP